MLKETRTVYSTYIFIKFIYSSTAGQEVINRITLQKLLAGQDREELLLEEMEDAIADAVYKNKSSKYHMVQVLLLFLSFKYNYIF